jgi:hypothetical protein
MLSLKQTFFLFLIMFFTNKIYSQNHNLEYNQIINFNSSTAFDAPCCNQTLWVTSSTFTVPSNKIWKVEGLYRSTVQWGGSGHTSYIIEVNNPDNLLKSNSDNNILWLSSGNYAIKSSVGCSGSCTGTFFNTVNAIEFNLVP